MFVSELRLVCQVFVDARKETQEFVKSASNFSRCFCEDIVQCSVKFFFLMDYEDPW